MICFAAQTDKADKAGPGMQQKRTKDWILLQRRENTILKIYELEQKLECPVTGCNLQLKAFAIKIDMFQTRSGGDSKTQHISRANSAPQKH